MVLLDQIDGENDKSNEVAGILTNVSMTASGTVMMGENCQNVVNLYEETYSMTVEEGVRTTAYRGFSVNDPYYKVLEMAYCNIDQCDKSGNQKGLCWAATAATMIRYRKGNRSITGWQLADRLGIGYDEGGYIKDIYNALNLYTAIEGQYQMTSREPADAIEIKHNINNQFPMAVTSQTGTYLAGLFKYGRHGHAVTVIGYKEENSVMTVIYWNSATCNVEVTQYNASGSTYFNMNGMKFKWQYTLMVPLY